MEPVTEASHRFLIKPCVEGGCAGKVWRIVAPRAKNQARKVGLSYFANRVYSTYSGRREHSQSCAANWECEISRCFPPLAWSAFAGFQQPPMPAPALSYSGSLRLSFFLFRWRLPSVRLRSSIPEQAACISGRGTTSVRFTVSFVSGRIGWESRSYSPGLPSLT